MEKQLGGKREREMKTYERSIGREEEGTRICGGGSLTKACG